MNWCDTNCLDINVGKTKEMVVDFRRNPSPIPPLTIAGETVERVEEYRYLGTIVDNKLNFHVNTERIYSRCRQRMHMLYQLRALSVSESIMERCYRSFIESVLTFSSICWFGSLGVKEKARLNGIVNECGRIVGRKQRTLTEFFDHRLLIRAMQIEREDAHILNPLFEKLPSGRRFRSISCRTNRFMKTFVPSAVSRLNQQNM